MDFPLYDRLLPHNFVINSSKTIYFIQNNNNSNNNHRIYIAPFQLFQLLKALHNVLLPQRPLHSRDNNLMRAGISRISTKFAFRAHIHMVSFSLLGTDYCSVDRRPYEEKL